MQDDLGSIERFYDKIKWLTGLGWPTAVEARRLTEERNALLASLPAGLVRHGCLESKPYTGALSPGCRACAAGTWSCLFVNRRCNVSCFYCPQDRTVTTDAAPAAEGLPFADPDAYVEYLAAYGFNGVSFSGGEPLLALDSVLRNVEKIRKRFGQAMYLWLYTNGGLLDAGNLQRLRDAGLDEIRINVSARGYDTKPVALARQFLNLVSVEVPAIPEDFDRLKRSLIELQQIGVDHVNIHQLTASKHNVQQLASRAYTFLHPNAFHEPPVHESEMAALALLAYAAENVPDLPVHYCSHAYKARFQNRAHRIRAAAACCETREEITEAGYIRRLVVTGSADAVAGLVSALRQAGVQETLWSVDTTGSAISVHGSLLAFVDLDVCSLDVSYDEAELRPSRTGPGVEALAPIDEASVCARRRLKATIGPLRRHGARQYRSLFIDRDADVGGATRPDAFPATGEAFPELFDPTVTDCIEWEWLPSGFPDIA